MKPRTLLSGFTLAFSSLICCAQEAVQTTKPDIQLLSAADASSLPFAEPCSAPTVNRSIRFCNPPEGVFLTSQLVIRAKALDSLPLLSYKMYINGSLVGDVSPDTYSVFGFSTPQTVQVTLRGQDAKGFFEKTTSFYVTGVAPCPANGADRTVVICAPYANQTATSPVHISGVATDSQDTTDPTRNVTIIYLDGKFARAVSGKVVNSWFLLFSGLHRITIQHQDALGNIFQTTQNVTVQ